MLPSTHPHLAFLLLTLLSGTSTTAAYSPITRQIQDVARLSPTSHVYVNGTGIPTMVRATTPQQAFNDSVAAQTGAPPSDARWWPAVADPSAPSFYGVAALADDDGERETVFLADTRFNVVQMADLKTGLRRLLFDPALLEVFANNNATTTATTTTATTATASGTLQSPSPQSPSSSSPSASALSGIIRTSREGRGDVLFVGLNNQIWRVPSPQPSNNVTTLGDAVEMLAAGFGAAWTVKDLCQYDNRVVVSVIRTAMPGASASATSGKPTPSSSSSSAAAVESHAPSSAVVIRYNVFPSGVGPSILGTPRIVRRVIMQPGVTAATFTPARALKLDCDATHVYIADGGVLAMHDLVTGKEIPGAARKIDVDAPTAVVVAQDGGVLVTGQCGGLWCADQLPPPSSSPPTTTVPKQTRTVFVTADLPEPTTAASS
ncbi:hypothetical protein HDU87_004067 [Geranomyces variabilis]|uniref:Uncharacterized protein n=1 Tax=Geranomyces variabilis TaxID=109894 RepID=A0AAD5XR17_9FUNG|nr:hypothetical protein HDU87_004067 [Geranomyces variabilis]